MKHRLVILKDREVRSGVINLRISKEKMTVAFESHGWRVLHLEPEFSNKRVTINSVMMKKHDINFVEIGVYPNG